ncbi:MAG: L,D-transpeptidase family protein [Bacillota bacterium]
MSVFFIGKQRLLFSVITMLLISLVIVNFGLYYWDEMQLAAIPNQPTKAPAGKVSIVIKIPARILELYEDGKIYKKYRVAVGKSETPSPVGEWIIGWKSYRSEDRFGTRFLALNVPWGGYGIHGTNQSWSIGRYASHGCIRLRNKDIEELYEWVPVGTPVRIEDQWVPIRRKLKVGSKGTDVFRLQVKLRELGYLEGRADGYFNQDTEDAVKKCQFNKGLKVTGVADKEIINLLGL